jgi:hypothetical protein
MERITLLLDFCLIFLWINPLTMATMTTMMMTMIPTHCIDISKANFLFLLMAMRETVTAVMTKMMMTTTMRMT